jgi:hypothetical protein
MEPRDRGVGTNTLARERLDYLRTIYERVGRYDRLIQSYEFQMFTVLSVLLSADIILIGVLSFFRLFEPLLWVFSAAAVGVAGVGVSALYHRRIQYYFHQREYSEEIAGRTEMRVVTQLFPDTVDSEREKMMTSKSLLMQPHTRQGLLLRATFYSYFASFVVVIVASAILAYQITQ